ncbi:hypothetical protein C8J57DRAFT_1251977 [Mycena rebaudengoi]|nr:hypothetical protein C8J57DRAFT_1251977 [Mycena rebaudengoi]
MNRSSSLICDFFCGELSLHKLHCGQPGTSIGGAPIVLVNPQPGIRLGLGTLKPGFHMFGYIQNERSGRRAFSASQERSSRHFLVESTTKARDELLGKPQILRLLSAELVRCLNSAANERKVDKAEPAYLPAPKSIYAAAQVNPRTASQFVFSQVNLRKSIEKLNQLRILQTTPKSTATFVRGIMYILCISGEYMLAFGAASGYTK